MYLPFYIIFCYDYIMSTYTIITEKMIFGGNCIAKVNGKTVFIPYSLPNEKLIIEITETYKDYDIAKIVEILTPSPHRIKPRCSLYGLCGGCNMMHIDDNYQIELRKSILKDCFERENIEIPEITAITSQSCNYRNRFKLIDGGLSIKKGNVVVNLTNCPVASPEINNYFKNNSQQNRPKGRVHVFGSNQLLTDSAFCKNIVIEQSKTPIAIQTLPKKKIKHQIKKIYSGTVIDEQNKVTIMLKGKKLTFDVRGFFQSNIAVLENIIDIVTGTQHGNNVLDMYSGCGTFSVFLADLYNKVYMVEHNRDAMVFAEQNMAGTLHEGFGVSGKNWIKYNAPGILSSIGNFDQVIIDPPRSGMEKEVCNWLCMQKIPYINSVSCNPSTHARDAAKLIKSGYTLTKLYLADFYPQTSNIESIACFEYRL